MNINSFYDLLDAELEEILQELDKNKDPFFVANEKNKDALKSRAFLIWFLKFYGKIIDYNIYITDGHGDSSCDIIINSVDIQGNPIIYIVQSKWNIKKNTGKEVSKKDILQALSEFDTILKEKKNKTKNLLLNENLDKLCKHIESNGNIKFIYLTLANINHSNDIQDNINSFLFTHKKTTFEWIDINRLRDDYINRRYKEIDVVSPLDKYFNPEEDTIDLEIAKSFDNKSFIHIEKPFEAYVFLIKPKVIHSLFKKYGFSLFQKNVRNPLLKSTLNDDIEKTIVNNPDFFWYYNNGITAITSLLPDGIRNEAVNIKVSGLQIINGAQTVYSIYKAYEKATSVKRQVMDSASSVTLRLLRSGGEDFDLNVTRYTNSQNPVSDRDFVANDDVQIRLQKESFNTPYWYEKRRSEFRVLNIPNIEIISNEKFARYYLAYYLHLPNKIFERKDKDLIFISHKEDKDGLYEKIFNDRTSFHDMLAGYYVYIIINEGLDIKIPFLAQDFIVLSLFSFVYEKYISLKYPDKINDISNKINEDISNNKRTEILQITKYIYKKVYINRKKTKEEFEHSIKLLESPGYYEKIKEELLIKIKKIEDIENVNIEKELDSIEKFLERKKEDKKLNTILKQKLDDNNSSNLVVNFSISSVIKKNN